MPTVRPAPSPMSSAIFATIGLMVPSTVAGSRKANVKCRKMRVGHDRSCNRVHCPSPELAAGIAAHVSEAKTNKSDSERCGWKRSAKRPPT